jgi:transcriptional regulator with XRE-family HTH domain
MRTFCQIVQEKRKILGYSPSLAAKIAGLHPPNYYLYESGKHHPAEKTVRRIAKALELDEDMLMDYALLDNGEIPRCIMRDSEFMMTLYDRLAKEWE